MRITRLFDLVLDAAVPQESKVRMCNVLRALLDNLEEVGCANDVLSLHRRRGNVVRTLSVDFPYVRETLREIFALPEVTRLLVRGDDELASVVEDDSSSNDNTDNEWGGFDDGQDCDRLSDEAGAAFHDAVSSVRMCVTASMVLNVTAFIASIVVSASAWNACRA